MQLNMKKSTEKELKKAKKMAAASEQKSKKNADSGSEPDTDNYIDSDGTSTAKTKDIKPGTAGAAAHTELDAGSMGLFMNSFHTVLMLAIILMFLKMCQIGTR